MTEKICSLPGHDCRCYSKGRCLYEEWLNPGLHVRFRCLVLKNWEGRFEEFLDRAERFDLPEQKAAWIWEARMRQALAEDMPCSRFQPGEDASELGCAYALQDVCLLTLPECPGRCTRYAFKGLKADRSESSPWRRNL